MKAYVLPPDALADEARRLEDMGLDFITIMDSAGTMSPDEVKAYVSRMVRRVSIPVGFHGHNNLGLSVANAVAAYRGCGNHRLRAHGHGPQRGKPRYGNGCGRV